MKRRDFLKGTTGLIVGSAVVTGFSPNLSVDGKKGTVVIIGAGLAGLSAALKLKNKGYKVTILEARNRIGGRVFTNIIGPQGNLNMEFGAEWVGESHERIKSFCKDFQMKLNNHRFEEHLFLGGVYQPYRSWTYEKEWNEKFRAILEGYKSMNDEQKKELDKLDWWRYLINNGITEKDLTIRELIDSTDFGESIRVVSADMAAAEYAESSPANEMDYRIEGGNSRLVYELARRVGEGEIKLGHKVSKIEQTIAGVTILCENGKKFTCDKAICSIPSFAINKITWSPELPQSKIDAVNSLQYSRIYKNGFLFRERFWKEEKFSLVTDMPGHYFFHSSQNQKANEGILTSYTIGDKAQMLHSMSKENRESLVLQSLPFNISDLREKLVTTSGYYWGNDAFSMGAYAIYGKGQWYTVRPELKKSVGNVHFAGEHLADWQGFMEGAINSGEEAAEEII